MPWKQCPWCHDLSFSSCTAPVSWICPKCGFDLIDVAILSAGPGPLNSVPTPTPEYVAANRRYLAEYRQKSAGVIIPLWWQRTRRARGLRSRPGRERRPRPDQGS